MVSISCTKQKGRVNQGQRWRRAALWKRQRALPLEPTVTGPTMNITSLMNPGCSPRHQAAVFCLQVWLSSTPFPQGTSQGDRCVCGSFSGHILFARCHSSHKLLKASNFPCSIVNVLLDNSGNPAPALDFHLYIYKSWFKKKKSGRQLNCQTLQRTLTKFQTQLKGLASSRVKSEQFG